MGLPVSTKITFSVSEDNWSKAFKIASKIPVGSVIGRRELVLGVQLPEAPGGEMTIDLYDRWGDVPLTFAEEVSQMIPTAEINILSGCDEAGDELSFIAFLNSNAPEDVTLDGDHAELVMKDGRIVTVECGVLCGGQDCGESVVYPRMFEGYELSVYRGTVSLDRILTSEEIEASRQKLLVTSSADTLDPADIW